MNFLHIILCSLFFMEVPLFVFSYSKLSTSFFSSFSTNSRIITNISAKRRTNISKFKNEKQLNRIGEFVDDIEEPAKAVSDLGKTSSETDVRKDLAASLEKQLQEDIKVFQSRNVDSFNLKNEATVPPQNDGIGFKVKESFSALLVADFFLIIFFLVWFIAASISKEVFASYFLIEKFQDIFQPIIQPALGLLMIGSVSSAFLKDKKEND